MGNRGAARAGAAEGRKVLDVVVAGKDHPSNDRGCLMRRTYSQAGAAGSAISSLGSPRVDNLLKNPVEKGFHAIFTRVTGNLIVPKIGRGQHFKVERLIVVDLADEFGHFPERTKASEIDITVGIEGTLHEAVYNICSMKMHNGVLFYFIACHFFNETSSSLKVLINNIIIITEFTAITELLQSEICVPVSSYYQCVNLIQCLCVVSLHLLFLCSSLCRR